MDELTFDGRPVPVRPGQSVAGALWAAGVRSWRTTRIQGAPRGLFCGIGACFDCLATIDGVSGQRACLAPARPGTAVTSQPTIPSQAPPPPAARSSSRADAAARAGYDLIVVGAGPAGLAAAATAALSGVRVALVDSAAQSGGQFWRRREGETATAR